MNPIAEAYGLLERAVDLSDKLCNDLLTTDIPDFKWITLTARLLKKRRTPAEHALLLHSLNSSSAVRELIALGYPDESRTFIENKRRRGTQVGFEPNYKKILLHLREHREIGQELFEAMIRRFLSDKVSPSMMALVLVMVVLEGLSPSDTEGLTTAMVGSGEVFDYRPFAAAAKRRIIRRYPTGGISEKGALILPSVLGALSDRVPLMSTILVGRSLGFTGGTWDKLSTIPGFTFAAPGEKTEQILSEARIAMCTTGPKVAPADQRLYSLRSDCGTIISTPLIVSSICSKHIAVPAHRLLLDVRYGSGAFMSDENGAVGLSKELLRVLEGADVKANAVATPTEVLTGSAVGNVVEVAEALAVMGGKFKAIEWNRALLDAQRNIVKEQVVHLVSMEFPDVAQKCDLGSNIDALFRDGTVLRRFYSLLTTHGVERSAAERICTHPESLLADLEVLPVRSLADTKILKLDQIALGNCINFGLAPPIDSSEPGQNRSGVVLLKTQGQVVRAGELLAVGFFRAADVRQNGELRIAETIRGCFRSYSESTI